MKGFLERHKICPLGLLLIVLGIGAGGVVLADEIDSYHLAPPRTGSGLISAFAILSGTLLQISRSHSRK